MQFKKLNTALFPIRYNDKYYSDVISSCNFPRLGTRLLNHALDLCVKQSISEIYLHVQTNNEDDINFSKKFAFNITDTVQNYYTNIVLPNCYVLTKSFSPAPAKK